MADGYGAIADAGLSKALVRVPALTMRRLLRLFLPPLLVLAAGLIYFTSSARENSSKPDFERMASYIEACGCDMYCPC